MKKIILSLTMLICINTFAGTLPDSKFTSGVVNPQSTKQVLCDPKFTTKTIRNVPEEEKNKVYLEYGIKDHVGYCSGTEGCEIDHLISLEIGGSNDIKNLWPQPYSGTTNAHDKDKLENKLHALVCSGKITLDQAQKDISTNWIYAYHKYIGKL